MNVSRFVDVFKIRGGTTTFLLNGRRNHCEIISILFIDDEQQAAALIYSLSRHVEPTNSRRTANERFQTNDKQLKDCRHE